MGSVLKPVPHIPAETFQAARKVYHLDHVYLLIGDHLEDILASISVTELDPTVSLGGSMTTRLALVTAFQYAERIPDGLAAQATFERMDWKYALHLPIQHPGYSAAALCQFRQHLFSSNRGKQEFGSLLNRLGAAGLYAKRMMEILDPGEVLKNVCTMSRLYQRKEAMKAALSLLVSYDPTWLRANALPHWYSRYQTGRLSLLSDLEDSEISSEIRAIEADLYYILKHVCQMNCHDADTQPVMDNLRVLFENLEKKVFAPNAELSGCEACISRNYGYF